MSNLSSQNNPKYQKSYLYLLVSLLSGLHLVGRITLHPTSSRLHTWLINFALLLCFCVPFVWKIAMRYALILALVCSVTFSAFAVVAYPRHVAATVVTGKGSDQDDAMIVGARKLASLQWPYDREFMWSKNPMSPGPGWLMLQAPAILAFGYGVSMLLNWVFSLAVIANIIGREATFKLIVLMLLSPSIWMATLLGSDFPSFGITLLAILLVAGSSNRFRIYYILAASLIYQFRFSTVFLPGLLRNKIGLKAALTIGTIAMAFQLIFLSMNPFKFIQSGPMHIIHKLLHLLGFDISAGASHAMVLTVFTALCLSAALFFTLLVGRRIHPLYSHIYALLLLIGLPALLELVGLLRSSGSLYSLRLWEGGIWLTALIPLTAMTIIMQPQAYLPPGGVLAKLRQERESVKDLRTTAHG